LRRATAAWVHSRSTTTRAAGSILSTPLVLQPTRPDARRLAAFQLKRDEIRCATSQPISAATPYVSRRNVLKEKSEARKRASVWRRDRLAAPAAFAEYADQPIPRPNC